MRSEPPRPSVTTLPSGPPPMYPGTTGTRFALSTGASRARAAVADSATSGLAPPNWPSVCTISTASTTSARRPARAMAPASSSADRRSPRATSRSRVRGDRWPRMPTAVQMSAYSPIDASMSASAARRTGPRGNSASAARRCFCQSATAVAAEPFASPRMAWSAPRSSRSVTPARAEATITSGPSWAAIRVAAACTAVASASDAPPNFHTCGALVRLGLARRREPEREGGRRDDEAAMAEGSILSRLGGDSGCAHPTRPRIVPAWIDDCARRPRWPPSP